MEMSGPIYVIGKQETAIAGTALMRIVISEEHTSPLTSDFSVANIFLFYFIYRILSSSWTASVV
jgi:hypothetical protein